MKNERPINLNLFTIKFPLNAIISILHRASGAFIFLLIPLFLWIFSVSVHTPAGFESIKTTLSNPFLKFIIWLSLTAVFYHLIAGIRHIIMDFGVGESLTAAKRTSQITIALAVLCSVIIGIWIW